MMYVLVRVEGIDVSVMKVAEVGDGFALVEGSHYVHVGVVSRQVSIREGFTVHEWHAIADQDLFHVRAGTRKKAVEDLLDRYGMHAVRDLDTIPALF